MRLSANNLNFMVQAVGLIIVQGLFIPVGRVDANAMLLIALYMGQDEEAHREFKIRLQDRGDLVCNIWQKYFDEVMERNLQDSNVVSDSVQDLIRRMSK